MADETADGSGLRFPAPEKYCNKPYRYEKRCGKVEETAFKYCEKPSIIVLLNCKMWE